MQTILNDIELDLAELKCLLQAMATGQDPTLTEVARRHIRQMRNHLNDLEATLPGEAAATSSRKVAGPTAPPEAPVVVTPAPAPAPAPTREEGEAKPAPILAERIRPAGDLRHALSLNDTFRFSRELFGGDTARMNEVLRQLEVAGSLEEALDTFNRDVSPEENNEAANDFIELLKKHFNR